MRARERGAKTAKTAERGRGAGGGDDACVSSLAQFVYVRAYVIHSVSTVRSIDRSRVDWVIRAAVVRAV